MISSWDIRLQEQVQRKFKNYKIISLDLGEARVDKEYPLPGDCLQVISVSSYSAVATVKLNINSNEPIELIPYRKIDTVFTKFFISNAAQAGESIDFIVGIDFGIQDFGPDLISTAKPAIIITNASADTNTLGAAHICNRVLIRAHNGNGGKAWIDFDAAAVEGSCFELTAGDSVGVPLSNTNKINVLFKTANDKVTVIYEV